MVLSVHCALLITISAAVLVAEQPTSAVTSTGMQDIYGHTPRMTPLQRRPCLTCPSHCLRTWQCQAGTPGVTPGCYSHSHREPHAANTLD